MPNHWTLVLSLTGDFATHSAWFRHIQHGLGLAFSGVVRGIGVV